MRKQYMPYLTAPLVTAALLLTLFWVRDLYPIRNLTIAWCDLRQQVVPLLMQTGDMLSGSDSLLYSLGSAGGMNFWGVFLFFTASPFSLLIPFVPKSMMMEFANVLVLLKMMVCALTAAILFRKCFERLSNSLVVVLSVAYAFCGYSMLFYQNNVWLDMMYLFPLLLLSVRALVRRGNVAFYTVMLSLVIVVNYYISYCVILFLILSFGIYSFFCLRGGERGRCIFLLGAGSLGAGLLTGVIWLPSLAQYLVSARTGNLLDGLKGGAFFTHLYTTWPFLYCTAAIFAALPFVFCKKLLASKEIRALLASFLFMLIPVTVEPINKMWHTGSYQAFPVRYGFITVMLGLLLTAAVVEHLSLEAAEVGKSIPGVGAAVGALLVLSVVSILFLTNHYEAITAYTRKLWGDHTSFLYLTIWFLAALGAMLILFLLLRLKLVTTRVFTVFLALMVGVQAYFSADVYLGSAAHDPAYFPWITDLAGKIDDRDFYRVKTKYKIFDVNLLGALGYPNLAHYTSLTREDYMFTMKRLGYSSYWMEVGSHGGSAVTDALLQNRYIIDTASTPDGYGEMIYTNRGYWIFQNLYQLPFGIVTGASEAELSSLPQTERVYTGEAVLNTLLGEEESVVTRYEPQLLLGASVKKDADGYHITASEGAPTSLLTYQIEVDEPTVLYFDCFDNVSNRLVELVNGSFDVSVDGIYRATAYPSQMRNGLLELGTYENQTVTVKVHLKKEQVDARSFGVYGIDQQALVEKLAHARGATISAGQRTFAGTAYAKEDGEYLFLPLPYDEGFSATLNGREVPVLRAFDSFIALRLDAGENEISLAFVPTGFRTGLLISVSGLLLFALLLFLGKGRINSIARFFSVPALILFYLLFGVILSGVYIMPMVSFLAGQF